MNKTFAIEPRRLLDRLFPSRHLPLKSVPGMADGAITAHVMIRLSLIDRLRVLLSGRACVTTRTYTSCAVDRALTDSVFYVLGPGRDLKP